MDLCLGCIASIDLIHGINLSKNPGRNDEGIPVRALLLKLVDHELRMLFTPFGECTLLAEGWIATVLEPLVKYDDGAILQVRRYEIEYLRG